MPSIGGDREGVGQGVADIERLHGGVAVVERVGPHAGGRHRVAAVAVGAGGRRADRRPGIVRVVDIGVVEIAGRGRRAGVPLATPPASTTLPVMLPVITAASLAPSMVIVTSCAVPSTVVTVNVSVRVWPTLSACTAALLLSSV